MALLLIVLISNAQLTQTVKGRVLDEANGSALAGATVVILNTSPLLGATTDENGKYIINNVPVGRQDIKSVYIGYEPYVKAEILVTTGKETTINFELKESLFKMDEVVVKAYKHKDKPLNNMATLSARSVSIEEAGRFAGALDDPGRLVSSFAGVAESSTENNGIIIRGNSPKGVLWRLEGVDIPNPNHFANAQLLGGGFVSALSSNVLSNSDFFTGAFPAEYGNALSGVFDVKLKTGNTENREYAFQAGVLGIDFASEGPIVKGKNASYIFNYRYSTFSLVKPMLDENHLPDYQDLSFKLNFPTQKSGTFSFWGLGAIDYIKQEVQDSTEWEWNEDKEEFRTKMSFGSLGLSHKFHFNRDTYINTSLSGSGNKSDYYSKELDNNNILQPRGKNIVADGKTTFSSFINHKFDAYHTNRSGIRVSRLFYDFDITHTETLGNTPQQIVNESGNSFLFQAYSQSKFNIGKKLTINAGLHFQHLAITGKNSIEPRLGLKWRYAPDESISIGYGLHSQTEFLNIYFIEENRNTSKFRPNKNLDFAKSHHFVMAYDKKISENIRLKIEPYYQLLYDLPVVKDNYYAIINLEDEHFFNRAFVNDGKGHNVGVDITFERFLNKGYYYLFTGSVFDSKYKDGAGKERNTTYNRNFVMNFLGGKEWKIGDNNLLSLNGKLTFMGGKRSHPYKNAESIAQKKIVYDYENAFSKQFDPTYRFDLTVSYRINKKNYSSVISLQFLNALMSKDQEGYKYNIKSNSVKMQERVVSLPVLSYRIEF